MSNKFSKKMKKRMKKMKVGKTLTEFASDFSDLIVKVMKKMK